MEYYTQEWREEALCRQTDADAFFAKSYTVEHREAVDMCRRCPVTQECLEEALVKRHPRGLWGGKTPKERKAILKERDTDAA